MSAITAALGSSTTSPPKATSPPDPLPSDPLELEPPGEPIVLPDGKRIYPPTLHGERVDELALALLDMDDPAALELPAPGRPARRGQEPDRARDRAPAVDRARPRASRTAAARRSTASSRCSPARRSDEFFFRHEWVPGRRLRRAGLARGLGVRAGDARGLGGDDRRGQHRPRRLPALDQRHPRRAPRAVPRRRPARP